MVLSSKVPLPHGFAPDTCNVQFHSLIILRSQTHCLHSEGGKTESVFVFVWINTESNQNKQNKKFIRSIYLMMEISNHRGWLKHWILVQGKVLCFYSSFQHVITSHVMRTRQNPHGLHMCEVETCFFLHSTELTMLINMAFPFYADSYDCSILYKKNSTHFSPLIHI